VTESSSAWFIYAISDADQQRCKVGYSQDPDARRSQLQTGCPFAIYVFGRWEIQGDEKAARGVEAQLKHILSPHKARVGQTEWFKVTPTQVDSVVKALLQLQGI